MGHLNYFGVKNFKVFKDLQRFDLKPITILVGANSSGKSSLTKAILSLKDSFSKIKVNSYESNSINIFSIESIDFNSKLNLGNFETIQNRERNDEVICFEMPFKFISNLECFVLRFEYKIAKNSLKSGELSAIKLYDPKNNEEFINFKYETGDLTINYATPLQFLKDELPKYAKLAELKAEKEKLREPFYYEMEFQEHLVQDSIKKDLENIEKKISELDPLYDHSPMYFESGFIDSFHSDSIYRDRLYKPHESFIEIPTLLPYSFLINEKGLDSDNEYYQISIRDKEQIIKRSKLFWEKIGKDPKTFIEELKIAEIEILRNFKINIDIFSDFQELNSLSALSSLLIYPNPEFINTFLNALAEYFPEIKDVYLNRTNNPKFSYYGSNCILKANDNSPFKSPEYFFNAYFLKSLKGGFRLLSSIYNGLDYIPSTRYKVSRVILNDGSSFFQEVLLKIHKYGLDDTSINFVNKYLSIFGIADSMEISTTNDSSSSKVILVKEGVREELADIGYGISQILPIILNLGRIINRNSPSEFGNMRYYEASVIIIEEPETNLHPALQSKLADMFVECYKKYNIQFILETHSEYLIRKMQYLIAKGIFKAEDGVIYNFRKTDNQQTEEGVVKPIKFHKDGSLSDSFYPGFFDESDNLAISLFNLNNKN